MTATLYSLNGLYPAPLPHIIYLSDGRPRSSQQPFTPAEIADAGYVAAPVKPAYDPATHALGWDGSAWAVVELPPPAPASLTPLTRRQLRLALLSIGVTAEDVEADIAAITNPVDRAAAMIEWEDATHYKRDHPLVADVAAAMALPVEQVDALWVWAAGL